MSLKVLTRFRLHLCRNYSVRVRFAPSPTGNLHLGGLRTALYNYIYSRSHKGKFILRIEDTDQTRLVPGTVEKLLEDLAWVGLNPDEGPNCGGSYGPYIQSERAKLYREEVETLLNTGSAYHCFCSERRLNILRKNALRNQEVPKYDNHCRSLPLEEVKKRLSSGQKSCIRLKLTSSEPFVDLVYGRTCHEVKDIEGDPVILKTDGFPTYHLANVIDDHHMQISHVIRGVEWLPSTNKHIMIYRALGYEPPKFVHLPLLLNSDGSKMSKRHGDLSVEVFRKKGLLPRALINFVVKAGSGFHTNSNDINHSLEELTNKFDLSLINNNSCRLPLDRLAEFNHAELKRQINNDDELVLLVRKVREMIIKHFHNSPIESLDLSDEYIKKVLKWSAPRISYINDLLDMNMLFLWEKPIHIRIKDSHCGICSNSSDILNVLLKQIKQVDFQKETLSSFLKTFSSEQKVPFKQLMELLRTSLSGLKKGPSVPEMMEILGKETTEERLKLAECAAKNI